jgi:hypothetical protein
MYRYVLAGAMLLAIAIPRAGRAQGTVAGTWITEFDIGIRNVDGEETSLGKRQARIVLQLKGDSVTGTWQALADSTGPAATPMQLRGRVADGKVELQTEPIERVLRVNDDEQRVKMISSYSFVVQGDTLDGTVQIRSLDGSFEGNARPFSAKREKN